GQEHGERKVFAERRPRYAADETALGWHVQHAAIGPGHRFVVPEEGLERFDGEQVRVRLWLRNRDVEEAETARDRAAAESAAARTEARRLRRSLRDAQANIERLCSKVDALHEDARRATEAHA